ncbi:MSC_0624 family F1-like ATPase-associated membrane protein [Mycoplasma miroungirhinis]|uniref:Transmembrane protein n=1 Tax=Mycoplasma miroungirhinis TaxID=754516 RepID=A0A6M4JI93_9MOLU|nr:hypothetical protein [Mycoplasma miroungirhinis]QJR44181.1 hypothetical protein HLA92_01915 [Mycoplasma miroungirhinis]
MLFKRNIQTQQTFDDYKSLKLLHIKNQQTKIYKIIVQMLLLVGSLFIFIFASNTIFAKNLLPNNDIQYFFNFENPLFKQINLLILIRFVFLCILFFYPLIKTHTDLVLNKQKTKKYLPWYIFYISIAISALVLFFVLNKTYTTNLLYLCFSLIIIYIVDASYSIYLYFVNKKISPEENKNSKWVFISLIAKFIIVLFIFSTLLAWKFSARLDNDFYLLVESNKFYDFITNLFSIKSVTNFIIIIVFILFALFTLFFSFINVFWLLIDKNKAIPYIKSNLRTVLIVFIPLVLWVLTTFNQIQTPISYVDSQPIATNYLYLLFLIIPITALTLYLVITFTKKWNIKSALINSTLFWSLQIIFWLTYWLQTFLNENQLINNSILFITLIFVIITFTIHYLKNIKYTSRINLLFAFSYFVLISVMIFVNTINVIALSNSNNNFNYISINMSLDEIFTVLLLIFSLSILITQSVRFWIEFNKLAKYSPQKEVSHEI